MICDIAGCHRPRHNGAVYCDHHYNVAGVVALEHRSDNRVSTANERQVGGNHYRQAAAASGEQHWDRQWRIHGRGYFIGQITRYVERYHLKNGLEDLNKAIHYLEKLKELEEAWINGTGPPPGSTGAAPLPNATYTKETK